MPRMRRQRGGGVLPGFHREPFTRPAPGMMRDAILHFVVERLGGSNVENILNAELTGQPLGVPALTTTCPTRDQVYVHPWHNSKRIRSRSTLPATTSARRSSSLSMCSDQRDSVELPPSDCSHAARNASLLKMPWRYAPQT